jgi:hypothetical protein
LKVTERPFTPSSIEGQSVAEFSELPAGIQRRLQELYLRVTPWPAAQRIWERLTDAERQQLGGDFRDCYARVRGTAQMWAVLKGVSPPRAIVEVAHELGFLDGPTFGWLMREIGEETAQAHAGATDPPKPRWNRDRGELLYDDRVVRQIRSVSVARNVVRILDAFHEQDWPERIDDPIPGGDPQRLREAIGNLNERLQEIRFRADGTGQGILWEPCSSSLGPTAHRP